MMKNVYFSSCKQSLFLSNITELEFSREILEMYLNTKFHENASCLRGAPLRETWQKLTDFSQICEQANSGHYNINTFVHIKVCECEVLCEPLCNKYLVYKGFLLWKIYVIFFICWILCYMSFCAIIFNEIWQKISWFSLYSKE
jgi:hypothetical protein